MGMDYFACRYARIDERVIEAETPKEIEAFRDAIDNAIIKESNGCTDADGQAFDFGEVLDDFARETEHNDCSYNTLDAEAMKPIEKAYKKLQAAFEKKTGLTLHIANVSEGLRGSDVSDETIWYIGNADIPNPKRVKLEKKHKNCVNYAWHLDAG